MAGAIMNKVWDFLGIDTGATDEEMENENDVYTYNYDKEEEQEEPEKKGFFGVKSSKIVSMPQPQQVRMLLHNQLVSNNQKKYVII